MVVYPAGYPDVEIPNVDLWTFLFERKTKDYKDSKELFTDVKTERCYTYGDMRSAALEFGKGLKARWDWKKGDVLAFYTPNSIDFPVVAMGLFWAGGIASPANPLYTVKELTFQLRDCGAKALVTQLPFMDTAREAAKAAGIPEDRIILLGDNQDPQGRFRHFSAIRSTAYCGKYAQTPVDPAKDLACLVYSSGTTGLPKGVCLSHRNIVANVCQSRYLDAAQMRPFGGYNGKGTITLGVLPFFHIYGLTCGIIYGAYFGWEMVVMERFDLEQACQAIEKHGITYIYVPPPIILALSKSPVVDKYDLTSLQAMNSGAAPLTKELTEALWNRLKIPVKQGYGLSETAPTTHSQLFHEWAKFMGSIGKLLPNLEARLIGEDGNDVAEGEAGELWVRGPNVFMGYLNQPEKTKDCMTDDGFFKTGDIMRRDKKGNYYVVDRLKELIKYKGFQVPPAELEGLLVGHEHIMDCGVIGIYDNATATEVPRAYVVLHPSQQRTPEKARELVEWAAGHTAPHKKLRGGIFFVDEIPKAASGKILRRVLREMAKADERKSGAKL